MRKRIKETLSAKATRLKQNYRVIILNSDQAVVIGDHSTYQVTRVCHRWTCDCPWGRFRGHIKDCSHVLAVKDAATDPASQAPVARLAEMLTAVGGE